MRNKHLPAAPHQHARASDVKGVLVKAIVCAQQLHRTSRAGGRTGRFHASLAFRREIFDRIGGWPLTKRGDFDQQLIARLHAIGAPGDPCHFADPSYIFRWGQTNAYHGQAFMQGPEDEGWYDRVQA